MISAELFTVQYKKLSAIVHGILKRWDSVHKILVEEAGLTEDGALLDRTLFSSHLMALKAEFYRLIGRQPMQGKMAVAIPYDVPNFLVLQYAGAAFLSGIPIEIHFAHSARKLKDIWQDTINSLRINDFSVDHHRSGKEFGMFALEDNEIRHLTLAGGGGLVEFYSKVKMQHLDTITVFGPTRPKTLILDDIDDSQLNAILLTAINTSMFNSGQLCALDKEILITKKNFARARDIATVHVRNISKSLAYTKHVAPILDGPAFRKGVEVIMDMKKSIKYEILAGGSFSEDTQFIEPTLIEAKGDIEASIDGFFPYVIIASAHDNKDALLKAKADTHHGCYAFIHTNNTNLFYSMEKELLGGHFGTVLGNSNILNHSIGQPYGGYKNSFFLRKRFASGAVLRLSGNHYSAHIVTVG